ncbi:MAG: ABC transporter ATP-binding protein [Elusimicrobiota bacterium]
MSAYAIEVENLSKRYRIGAHEGYRTFQETLMDSIKAPFQRIADLGKPVPEAETIWALDDVSFKVKKGEAIGIIGRNGAGKSTILRVLSRITEPTKGRVILNGRVGSLLEVGTGFHPELSGHENIYMYGAILGMHRDEISRKFDEIVSFAEVERFIDTPVKRYSSGMYMRLAFSVAAHMEPDILIVDEVLAVGDANFQRKCIAKMGKAAEGGRTVLLVSHNMAAISSICQKGILFDEGKIKFSGPAHECVSHYLDQHSETARSSEKLSLRKDRTGSGEVKLTRFYLENEAGEKVEVAANGQTIRLVFEYAAKSDANVENLLFQFVALKQSGEAIFQFGTRFTGQRFANAPSRGRIICEIKRFPLVTERYRLDAYLVAGGIPADFMTWASQIDVVDGDFYRSGYQVFEKESQFLVDGSVSIEGIE